MKCPLTEEGEDDSEEEEEEDMFLGRKKTKVKQNKQNWSKSRYAWRVSTTICVLE